MSKILDQTDVCDPENITDKQKVEDVRTTGK
jgi:hypothetical protein